MRIFLTGANGYLGRNFIKKAIEKNHKIFAVTRKKKNKKLKNVKWLIGSIDKKWKELGKSDVLLHFATVGAYDKFSDINKTYEFNVNLSSKLLLNCIHFNCKKWVIISTNKEKKIEKLDKSKKINKNFLEPHFNYAFTKYTFSKIAKSLSRSFNINCRIIKLFHVYGADEKKTRLWPLLNHYSKKNKNLDMTSGHQTYDFNHINDVIDGLIECLNFKKKNKSFPQEWDLASGKSMSVREFAKKIWKKNKAKSKINFSSIKNFDKNDYLVDKKILWKINSRKI